MTNFLDSNRSHLSDWIDILDRFSLLSASPFRVSKRSNGEIKSSIFLLWKTKGWIDLVLKHRKDWDLWLLYSFPYEYAFIAYLWRKFPELRNQLPQVYGIAKDSQGRILWIITEKFPGNEDDDIFEVSYHTFDDQQIIKKLRELKVSESFIWRLERSMFNCPDPEDSKGRCIKIWDLEEIGATLVDPEFYIPSKEISTAEKIMHRYWRMVAWNLQALTYKQTR